MAKETLPVQDEELSSLALSIAKGLKEALALKRGENPEGVKVHRYYKTPAQVDVKAIRKKLNMTQEEFTVFGFSLSAIKHWEGHTRTPEGPARVLLKIIEQNPKMVIDVIQTH